MSEKKKFVITEIKENPWKKSETETVIYYNCKTIGGIEYTTTDPQVKQFIGQEREYDVNSKVDKTGVERHYINFGKAGGGGGFSGGKKPFVPSFRDSRDAVILNTKAMLLSYCKDGASKMMETTVLKPADYWKEVKTGFSELLPLLDLDNLPKVAEFKSSEATGPSTTGHGGMLGAATHVLSREKQVIIYKQMQRMKFTAKDLIDFAGAAGIEIHYQPEEDKALVSQLSEEQGGKLINALTSDQDIPF